MAAQEFSEVSAGVPAATDQQARKNEAYVEHVGAVIAFPQIFVAKLVDFAGEGHMSWTAA